MEMVLVILLIFLLHLRRLYPKLGNGTLRLLSTQVLRLKMVLYQIYILVAKKMILEMERILKMISMMRLMTMFGNFRMHFQNL